MSLHHSKERKDDSDSELSHLTEAQSSSTVFYSSSQQNNQAVKSLQVPSRLQTH